MQLQMHMREFIYTVIRLHHIVVRPVVLLAALHVLMMRNEGPLNLKVGHYKY